MLTPPSYRLQRGIGQKTALQLPHELVGLLRKRERQDRVRQDPGEMRQEALVDGEEALRPDRLCEAVQGAGVEIAVLVVHAGHDGVYVG